MLQNLWLTDSWPFVIWYRISNIITQGQGEVSPSIIPYFCCLYVRLCLDAILGLKELLDSNWELIDLWMTPLFTALVRLIGDEVWLLDCLGNAHILSWLSGCQCSQTTHLFFCLVTTKNTYGIQDFFLYAHLSETSLGRSRTSFSAPVAFHHLCTNTYLPWNKNRFHPLPRHSPWMRARSRDSRMEWK